MRKVLMVGLLAAALTACTAKDETLKRIVESQGYTNVQSTGYAFLGCGDDDDLSTGFTATAPNGAPVSGVVCSQFIGKGATIRLLDVGPAPVKAASDDGGDAAAMMSASTAAIVGQMP